MDLATYVQRLASCPAGRLKDRCGIEENFCILYNSTADRAQLERLVAVERGFHQGLHTATVHLEQLKERWPEAAEHLAMMRTYYDSTLMLHLPTFDAQGYARLGEEVLRIGAHALREDWEICIPRSAGWCWDPSLPPDFSEIVYNP